MQPGFTDCIIKEVGLEEESKEHAMLALAKLITKDENGKIHETDWKYH